ncbi:MAG: hypothetical protein PHV34_13890 [Verrucomicrobiae bacterium]|nr:hypothetical protein [Verrucomicrobiae bacterium]
MSFALQAGERWRHDVRSATRLPRSVQRDGLEMLQISLPEGEVAYFFRGQEIWRRTSGSRCIRFLEHVKNSRMILDRENGVPSCRWELELMSHRPSATLKPLFSFQAVSNLIPKP